MQGSIFRGSLSLARVSNSVRRFLANVTREQLEPDPFDAPGSRPLAPSATDGQLAEEAKIPALPPAIASAAELHAAQRAQEAADLAAWRAALAQHIAIREARCDDFRQFLAALDADLQRRKAAPTKAPEPSNAPQSNQPPAPQGDAATPSTTPSQPASAAYEPAAPALDTDPEIRDLNDYRLPPADLLAEPDFSRTEFVSAEALEAQKIILQDTLDSFAVDARVYDAIVGPRVTQFRLQPGTGVRVEAIAALQRNFSLALASTQIRIQAPIPGEPFVGVEVSNTQAFPVQLRALLESRTWHSESEALALPLILGMDIQGSIIITDLAKAPHLLIAGATGSGKSVCMSSLVLSLLYRFRPNELELVLIDPKRVEFGLFKSIPHLIHPVVTEPQMAVQVLKWVVNEMQRRYEVMSEAKVRNIAGFNAKAAANGTAPMPFMVVVIDELADLMMTSKGEAEAFLARIAQLSRAVGIHTIIATQRPSVNVITGVIKANYPTRIAFQVSSQIDSRTILDCKGAESLLGKGDMLFNPPGIARLLRIQSPMVSDPEIQAVVDFLAPFANARSSRIDLSTVPAAANAADGAPGGGDEDSDEGLLHRAMEIVAHSQKASTSYLQRRLRIGYNRAALLIEEMEDRAYIGPANGSTPREVFIAPEDCQWPK